MVALLHRAHAAYARILIGEAAHEVVQETLAHRALRDPDAIHAEVLDDLQQNRESGGKYRRALGVDVLEIEVVDVACRYDTLGEAAQIIESDARRIRVQAADDVADDPHRTRAPECLQPAELAIGLLNRFELEPHRSARPLESLLRYPAVVETAAGQADAADRQALEKQWIEAFTDDHLGRAAADIDHQAFVGAHR